MKNRTQQLNPKDNKDEQNESTSIYVENPKWKTTEDEQ